MVRARLALGAAAIAAACAQPGPFTFVLPDLPPEVDVVAIVFETADGEPIAATGVFSREEPQFVSADRAVDGDDVVVRALGWKRQDLEGAPPGEALRSVKLERASEADPVLPPASFEAIRGGAARSSWSAAAAESGPWTAAWLPRCPTLIAPGAAGSLDTTCAPKQCVEPVEQRGCDLEVHLGRECGNLFDSIPIDGRGRLSPGRTICGEVPPPEGAFRRVECAGDAQCRADIYLGPFAPRLDVELLSIIPGVPLGRESVHPSGYLSALAVLSDRVVVVSFDGRVDGFGCRSGEPTRLHFIDPERLEVTGTATAPPCLTLIEPLPSGDAFVGFYGGTSPRVGRFDAAGKLLASAPVAFPEIEPPYLAHSIALAGQPLRIVAGFIPIRGPGEVPSMNGRVGVFDPVTFERLAVSESFGDAIPAISPMAAGRVAAANSRTHQVMVLDLETARTTHRTWMNALRDLSRGPENLIFHEASSTFVTSTSGWPKGAVQILPAESAGDQYAVLAWERPGSPWAIVTWPSDPRLAVVALSGAGDDEQAWFALLDPAGGRYLPGASPARIAGAPLRLVPDRAGRVWAMLAWTAHISRISPRTP